MWLVVRGLRRTVQLEGSEHSLGYTGQSGPQRGEGVSGTRATSGSVREPHGCSQVVGEWRLPRGFAEAELDESHELTEKVRRGGQSRGGVRRRTRRRSRWLSQAQVQQGGLPERGRLGRVDASTFQEGEAGASRSFNNTASVGASRWRPPLVDEDWHAMCPATCKGVEGAQWENLCYKFVEMNNEVNVRRAKTHWKIRDARERGDAHCDQTSEQHIVNRDAFRDDL